MISILELNSDKKIKSLSDNLALVNSSTAPGFSEKYLARRMSDLPSKEDFDLEADKRVKMISKETLSYLSARPKKFKLQLNSLKNKVHAIQRR